MRVLFTALLILLSGCLASNETEPLDDAEASPTGSTDVAEDAFEPLVFTGTVSGAADCASYGLAGVAPQTPEVVALPAEAAGRTYHLSLTPSTTAPNIGVTCLIFSDGTFKDGSQIESGKVPSGVDSVQIITNANMEMAYELTID